MNGKILLALCAASLAIVPACKKEKKEGKNMEVKGKKKKHMKE